MDLISPKPDKKGDFNKPAAHWQQQQSSSALQVTVVWNHNKSRETCWISLVIYP